MTAIRLFSTAGKVLAAGLIVKDYFVEAAFCSGQSMHPTLEDEDVLLVNKFSKHFGSRIDVGSLYIFVSPVDPNKLICKRILAKENDCVEIVSPAVRSIQVPKGHVWLEGDNKPLSNDSRTFGSVPIGLLHGKVEARIWPISKATRL